MLLIHSQCRSLLWVHYLLRRPQRACFPPVFLLTPRACIYPPLDSPCHQCSSSLDMGWDLVSSLSACGSSKWLWLCGSSVSDCGPCSCMDLYVDPAAWLPVWELLGDLENWNAQDLTYPVSGTEDSWVHRGETIATDLFGNRSKQEFDFKKRSYLGHNITFSLASNNPV